jgi:glycosyltransferase involved in cell wall biosynthesis
VRHSNARQRMARHDTRVRVCFASHAGFAGCVTSGRHAAAVLGGTAVALQDGERPPPSDLLILSGWRESYLALLDAAPRVAIRFHSPLLQAELSEEGAILERLLALRAGGRVHALAFNDHEAARAFGGVHLPDVLAPVGHQAPRALEGVNVTLLGEPRPRKNVVVQAAAFAQAAGPDWTLHLTGRAARYAGWLDALGVGWVDHGSLPHADLLGLVAGCDAGLAATLSESFGYVAAEHLQLGVPVVTSAAVRCADTGDLQVGEPGSVDQVAAALTRAIGADVSVARRSLEERAAANAQVARAALAALA